MKLAHSDRTRPRRRARGFTLPDVLICTTIVACLSAIALPSYHRTILKDRRTIARTALTDLAARQETQVLLRGAHATD
ncbi:MAG TPA: pilus assembly protein PilE, partial [Candidatus Limnocylindria bacterium]|nr:pilus assembly protein PilE [Candidatus Limnocylindria bacterium]